jgi:hypothetical protein
MGVVSKTPRVRLTRWRGRLQLPPLRVRGQVSHPPDAPPLDLLTPPDRYRGARQALPGCPTSATGVPDKNYRGAQQVGFAKIAAKRGLLSSLLVVLCYCFSCSVMLLNNNYRENGEDDPWGQIASN